MYQPAHRKFEVGDPAIEGLDGGTPSEKAVADAMRRDSTRRERSDVVD